MESLEERQSNNGAEDKITTFASPTVLAAILDEEPSDEDVIRSMVASSGQEEQTERVTDSLESSLNDSLEFSKPGELNEPKRVESTKMKIEPSQVETSEDISDIPKSSTPLLNDNMKHSKKVGKPKPRKPQHIIERNKERVGKKVLERTGYAQVHGMRTRKNVEKSKEKSGNQTEEAAPNVPGSGLESQSQHSHKISDDFNSQNSVSPVHYDNDQNLLGDSSLEKSLDTYHSHSHGPYYDVSQEFGSYYNPLESNYSDLVGYSRGYQGAAANSRQRHSMAGSFQPTHNSLSTQSAPPGVYGYQRTPLISSVHNLHKEDYNSSSALSDTDFQNLQKANKFPESSLHRKFSSEPYLANPSSLSLHRMADADRSSKASGSYSSLRQPLFQYKPYSLKDYRNFVGSEVERPAGGLGPNNDTDDFKEKMRKVSKQREYAAMLRAQHSTMKKQQEKKGSIQQPVKPKHIKEAEAKRQAALNYAKNVPKPKQMVSRRRGSPRMSDTQADDDQEITILEILRLRHEKEKKEVDTIRKDLASKIRL